jgi:hypothetical protein
MQETWGLVSRRHDRTGVASTGADGRRVMGEERCRDAKHPGVGRGLTPAVSARPARRDARCLLAVRAPPWLTGLVPAGQALGRDRLLGATRPGPLSRFRQGLRRLARMPKRQDDRLHALATTCRALLQEHARCTDILGVI